MGLFGALFAVTGTAAVAAVVIPRDALKRLSDSSADVIDEELRADGEPGEAGPTAPGALDS